MDGLSKIKMSKWFGSPRSIYTHRQYRKNRLRLVRKMLVSMRNLCFVLIVLGIVSQSEAGIYPKSVLESPRFLELSGGLSDWDGGDARGLSLGYSSLWKPELTSRLRLSAGVNFKNYDLYSQYEETVDDSTINPTLWGSIGLSDDMEIGESGLYWAYSFSSGYDFSSSELQVPSTGQMLSVIKHDLGAGFYSDLNFPINFPDNSISIAPFVGLSFYLQQSYGKTTNIDTDKSISSSELGFLTGLKLGLEVRIIDLFFVNVRRSHPFDKDYVPTVSFSIFKPFIF